MRRRHKRGGHSSHDRWLVSYADFITLLFAFFVVLYASSQVDKRKVGKLALAIQVAFQEMGVFQASSTKVPVNMNEPMPFSTVQAVENMERSGSLARVASHPEGRLGEGGFENGDLTKLENELAGTLAGEIKRNEIAMRRDADGLVISLREAGFFESGSATMKSTSQATFDRIASLLRVRECYIRVEGHTDNVPIHNAQFSSNWELSTSRATEIVRLLIVRDGYSAGRLSAAGYAEFHPIAPNDAAEGRALNRRVDIVVLRQEAAPSRAMNTGSATVPPAPTVAGPPTLKPSAAVAAKPQTTTAVARSPN